MEAIFQAKDVVLVLQWQDLVSVLSSYRPCILCVCDCFNTLVCVFSSKSCAGTLPSEIFLIKHQINLWDGLRCCKGPVTNVTTKIKCIKTPLPAGTSKHKRVC